MAALSQSEPEWLEGEDIPVHAKKAHGGGGR